MNFSNFLQAAKSMQQELHGRYTVPPLKGRVQLFRI
jgi:hypothetical protein